MWRKVSCFTARARGSKMYQIPVRQRLWSRERSMGGWLMSAAIGIFILSSCSSQVPRAKECEQGLILCGNSCFALTYDVYNCGACGNQCPRGQVCSNSRCLPACEQGLKNCSDNCVPLSTPCTVTGISGTGGTIGSTTTSTISSGGSTASTGVGGTTTTSSSAAGAGGTTGAAGSAGGSTTTVPNAGYITSGTWHGYAWTDVQGGTITPNKTFTSETDFPLCASGSINSDPDYKSVAIVGWNINQANGTNPPTESVTPTKAGIIVNVTNKGGSELRAQIQGPSGATSATDRWCAAISGSGGFMPFSSFNTQCWQGGSGTAYSSQPIVAAMVIVPGSNSKSIPFDFCITKIAESDTN